MGLLSRLFGKNTPQRELVAAPVPVAAVSTFASRLYGELARNHDGNLFYSPESIRIALAMAYIGARGKTAGELRTTLDLPEDAAASLKASLDVWNGLEGIKLAVANQLWGARELELVAAYQQTLASAFGAPMEQVDFVHAPEAARVRINTWVAERTSGNITELVPPAAITADTRLVLTNAIYFKGRWENVFRELDTSPRGFRVRGGKPVDVPMMNQQDTYAIADTGNATMLTLPYASQHLAMDIILPNAPADFAAVESAFAGGAHAVWLAASQWREVIVRLPRFMARTTLSLVEALQKLGVTSAFALEADFSGMATNDDLKISDVLHQAYLSVNEEGTEAAAATDVLVETASAALPEEPVVFAVDQPFLFVIRATHDNTPLFVGRILDPRS